MNKHSLLSIQDLSIHDIMEILHDARVFNISQQQWNGFPNKNTQANRLDT